MYIMASKHNTTIYVGVTSNLKKRVLQHKSKHHPHSFTARYNCSKLVYYNEFASITAAIREEKRIKGGSRLKKEILINTFNPDWNDLSIDWYN